MASCRSGRASDPELLNCFLYAHEPENTLKQDGGVGPRLLGSISVALGCNGALPLEQASSDSGFPCTGHCVSRVRKERPCPKHPAGQGPESAARQLGNLGIPAGRAGRELKNPRDSSAWPPLHAGRGRQRNHRAQPLPRESEPPASLPCQTALGTGHLLATLQLPLGPVSQVSHCWVPHCRGRRHHFHQPARPSETGAGLHPREDCAVPSPTKTEISLPVL